MINFLASILRPNFVRNDVSEMNVDSFLRPNRESNKMGSVSDVTYTTYVWWAISPEKSHSI